MKHGHYINRNSEVMQVTGDHVKRYGGCGSYSGFIAALGLTLIVMTGCGGESTSSSEATVGGLRVATVDTETSLINVDRFLRNPPSESGRIAVHGVVIERHEQRRALVLVDNDEFSSCGYQACTDAIMRLQIKSDSYKGELPEPGETVTIIGDYEPLERGYRFDPDQIHRNGYVILDAT